ncbi:MAG TPA: RNA polymerase sporulation sigma factor SigE [Firmicutes bacterium]|nr:RNA polymerase sporulation sigma factor SigE [Bacillota bacterium]HAZ22930.1 RNA polymerase sporulation sigma factor SigE [Bacillota bacterium]HBE06005.1 RNA polymerase sporulation sigma factor SigE [Bacillota bacterium]HBG43144.1 RNA polymerase sporulation sigma factor SigE [Bacillota bacterium]HBL50951.1 RNA polymerase sporulation sigma factor SigE [Bacillota bacterium]
MLPLYKRTMWIIRLTIIKLLRKLGMEPSLLYVGSSEALPPPLSADEEVFLLERLLGGDQTVRGVLIERNLRLVVYIGRKFENTGVGIEDLVSIGTIGLIKAVNTFDPAKKIKLATYASRCIENEILMYLRRNNKTRAEISFDEPLNIDWDGNELLLSDVWGTEGDVTYKSVEEGVDRNLLETAINRLTPREKRIVELRFGLQDGNEKTQKEVADFLGISQSYISRLEKRIIKKLRREMRRMD